MISSGDKSARDAFRAALREDTPIPVAASSTQELDALDILEVQDVAEAIARAEQSTPNLSRARPRDIFDRLVSTNTGADVPTDDASGPALPVPPELLADDAYYHPGGRVRSFADVTLDGYRPEPTLLLRIRERRSRASWLVIALLLPLTVLAVAAVLSLLAERPEPTSTTTLTPAVIAKPAPAPTAPAAEAKPVPSPSTRTPEMPSFDVKSLPAARR